MSIELLKSISTQKAHKTYYKQGSILHYLGTNQFFHSIYSLLFSIDLFSYKIISTNTLGVYKRHLDVSKSYRKGHENHFPKHGPTSLIF